MKTSTLAGNGVSTETADLIGRLIELIGWPERRSQSDARQWAMWRRYCSMASRAWRKSVFGWNRRAVELGIHEHQTGIACVNDISSRVKPKTEDKHPKLLAEIQAIMEPHSESESSLRTTLLYTNMTAKTVHGLEKSWNGYLLDTVYTVVSRAENFYWRGMRTVVRLVDTVYEKGIKICRREKKGLEQRLLRSTDLNWWDITIQPKTVYL